MSDAPSHERLMICNCKKTMDLDGDRLRKALKADGELPVHAELCRGGIASFERALSQGEPLHIACTQEAALFREVAEEKGFEDADLTFTNIRETAGWCEAKSEAIPKMAALLAQAAYQAKPTGALTLNSEGVCLVYGAGQAALDVAVKLSRHLSVSVVLSDAGDVIPPSTVDIAINKGRIKSVSGHLGAFEVVVDGYAAVLPSCKDALEFSMSRDGAKSECDVIFDMAGGTPLVSAPDHRDGYFHVDPNHPVGIADAIFEAIDFVGEFEKPLYVAYDAGICAHARSGQVGCSNCIDTCPAGAISPDGDTVKIDPAICDGCGSCSAVCPTGAVSYAYPPRHDIIARAGVLLGTFERAGGKGPAILVHDHSHGAGLISAMARFGRGLPPSVLPLSVYSVYQIGHEAIAAMLTAGAEHVAIMARPDKPDDLPALTSQVELINVVLEKLGFEGRRVHVINETDPDAAQEKLYSFPDVLAIKGGNFDPVGSKRDIARSAFAKLHTAAPAKREFIELPAPAPYGCIEIDTGKCTLCLSCVGACPAGALADNADRPEVSFTESACVQCGLCRVTCPEDAITLVPRFNFTNDALSASVLHTEEPFECVRCAKPFGTRSMVEKVVERLEGHSMFKNEAQLRLIQMCDNCRVITMAEKNDDPFSKGERPRIRTTDDDLLAEAQAEAAATTKSPKDYLS